MLVFEDAYFAGNKLFNKLPLGIGILSTSRRQIEMPLNNLF
jgi:hypothetical protein